MSETTNEQQRALREADELSRQRERERDAAHEPHHARNVEAEAGAGTVTDAFDRQAAARRPTAGVRADFPAASVLTAEQDRLCAFIARAFPQCLTPERVQEIVAVPPPQLSLTTWHEMQGLVFDLARRLAAVSAREEVVRSALKGILLDYESCLMNPDVAPNVIVARAALATYDAPTATGTPDAVAARPKIVCLCGSTRFYEAFQAANYRETMAGNIVLSVGFYPHAQEQAHGEAKGCTSEQKIALDELHKRKIDLADEVLVLNVDQYVGDSTRSEIAHARATGKPVRYLEAVSAADDYDARR